MTHRIVRVEVDEDVCLSHELCTMLAPKVFREGEHYFPVVANDAESHFDSRRREVIDAVLSCPVSALALQFEGGKVITSRDWEEVAGVDQWVEY